MRSEFEVAFNEIAELRSLPRETVLEALSTALVSAYKRDAGVGSSQRVEATIDPGTGRARIFVEKEVVDEVQDQRTEVDLERARYYDQAANLGDMVMVQVEGTTKKFGRIAAQTAKQVILQKIREAERNSLYDEFAGKEGDVITGVVQSVNATMVSLSLNNRAEAILPRAQQIPGEKYRAHEKLRVYILEVKRSNRGPQIVVSRTHRDMLRRLLEYEVPEIYNGQVDIKAIAREAGYRSKVAVMALQEGVDPVGACVGQRGMRIQNIVKELHEEKIDVIEWNPNQEIFIAKALSPARVSGVYLEDDPDSGRTAVVIVPDDQLSLAIGREGQNARLAAKLTNWRIDIKSVTEAVQETLDNLHTPPLRTLRIEHADSVAEVERVMEKRAANRPLMPEDYQLLARFADLAQKRLMQVREQARQARLAEINAVKATLPPAAFHMPISTLGLPDAITEALQPLGSVGEIMLRFLIDEKRLHALLIDCPPDSLIQLQDALDNLVIPELFDVKSEPEVETAPEPASEQLSVPAVMEMSEETEDDLVPEAFADEPLPVSQKPQSPVPQPTKLAAHKEAEIVPQIEFEEEEADLDILLSKKSPEKIDKKDKKKERQQRRQMVYDEELGEMVVKRRRKSGRDRSQWGDEWNE